MLDSQTFGDWQDCAETINEFASQEIKDEYLPRIKGDTCSMDLTEPDAGSDLQGYASS